jgi:hypothetical protein
MVMAHKHCLQTHIHHEISGCKRGTYPVDILAVLNPHATKSKSLFEFEQEDQIRRLLDSEHQVDVQCLNFEAFSVVRGGTT